MEKKEKNSTKNQQSQKSVKEDVITLINFTSVYIFEHKYLFDHQIFQQ